MITKPMDVLTNYEIRKTKKQKSAFITAVTAYAASQRYSTKIEKGRFGCRNIVIGDPVKADYVITAHYDTCAWLPLPNFITPMCLPVYILYQLLIMAVMVVLLAAPGWIASFFTDNELISNLIGFLGYTLVLLAFIAGPANRHNANDNTSGVVTLLQIMESLPDVLRDRVCFVLFDLEESGLIGSSVYRKKYRTATERQTIINMDCVGDGDEIMLIPNKKLRRQEDFMSRLDMLSGTWGSKRLRVHKKGLAIYPSDQMNFPNSMAVAAFHRKRFVGLYMGRIHTHRDTILDRTNVNILRAALISLVANPNNNNTSKG